LEDIATAFANAPDREYSDNARTIRQLTAAPEEPTQNTAIVQYTSPSTPSTTTTTPSREITRVRIKQRKRTKNKKKKNTSVPPKITK
jgi:hypothetical protein